MMISSPTAIGRAVVFALVCAFTGFGMVSAQAQSAPSASADAEAYVQALADEVSAVLSDDALSTETKASELRGMIDQYLDVRRIAYFALGRYRRDAADQGVLEDYVSAFKEYSISLYETRLTEYGGETLRVTGSEDPRGKGKDFVVMTVIEGNGEPLNVNWRVIVIDEGFTIIDAQIEGIWLALDLREQFASIITNNGGEVQFLIDHLRERTL